MLRKIDLVDYFYHHLTARLCPIRCKYCHIGGFIMEFTDEWDLTLT